MEQSTDSDAPRRASFAVSLPGGQHQQAPPLWTYKRPGPAWLLRCSCGWKSHGWDATHAKENGDHHAKMTGHPAHPSFGGTP
jgi:hypothetical protein